MIETFGFIQGVEDFFSFFDNRFECIKNDSDKLKVYKVSFDETLAVLTDIQIDPDQLRDYHYNIILFPKKDELEFIRVYGSFYNKDNQINDGFYMHLKDKKLSNKSLISNMNRLEYRSQSINPLLLLFGLNKKQRYIMGDLKYWIRTSDGKLVAKENLKDRVFRKKKWEKEHPSSKNNDNDFKFYESQNCSKANCVNFKNNECVFSLYPCNDSKSFKLKNATGYCEDYYIKDIDTFIEKKLLILNDFNLKIDNLFKLLIRKFDDINYEVFDLNITSSNFNSKRFSILIAIVDKLKDFKKKKVSVKFKSIFNEKVSQFDEVVLLIKDYGKQFILTKTYKKVKKAMDTVFSDFFCEYENLIFNLRQEIKVLELHNRLVKRLFTGRKNICLSFGTLKEEMIVYFDYSKINEEFSFRSSKKVVYTNIGRVYSNSKWNDCNLSPSHHFSIYDKLSYYDEFPIYKVISVKKSEILLENIDNKQEVKLISSRKYYPHILFFKSENKHNVIQKDILPKSYKTEKVSTYLNESTYIEKCLKSVKISDFTG